MSNHGTLARFLDSWEETDQLPVDIRLHFNEARACTLRIRQAITRDISCDMRGPALRTLNDMAGGFQVLQNTALVDWHQDHWDWAMTQLLAAARVATQMINDSLGTIAHLFRNETWLIQPFIREQTDSIRASVSTIIAWLPDEASHP